MKIAGRLPSLAPFSTLADARRLSASRTSMSMSSPPAGCSSYSAASSCFFLFQKNQMATPAAISPRSQSAPTRIQNLLPANPIQPPVKNVRIRYTNRMSAVIRMIFCIAWLLLFPLDRDGLQVADARSKRCPEYEEQNHHEQKTDPGGDRQRQKPGVLLHASHLALRRPGW